MSLPIVFRRQARYEFDDAVVWYEERKSGLGIAFLVAVQRVLDQISANLFRYAIVLDDVREGLVRRFPYAVYFRVEDLRIVILAVFHASRDPEAWKSRAKEPDE